jgi:hypothetical protein
MNMQKIKEQVYENVRKYAAPVIISLGVGAGIAGIVGYNAGVKSEQDKHKYDNIVLSVEYLKETATLRANIGDEKIELRNIDELVNLNNTDTMWDACFREDWDLHNEYDGISGDSAKVANYDGITNRLKKDFSAKTYFLKVNYDRIWGEAATGTQFSKEDALDEFTVEIKHKAINN